MQINKQSVQLRQQPHHSNIYNNRFLQYAKEKGELQLTRYFPTFPVICSQSQVNLHHSKESARYSSLYSMNMDSSRKEMYRFLAVFSFYKTAKVQRCI